MNPSTGELIQLPALQVDENPKQIIPSPGTGKTETSAATTVLFEIPWIDGKKYPVTQKTALYLGMGASAIGILSFFSTKTGGKKR
jgi:hypothetical protein